MANPKYFSSTITKSKKNQQQKKTLSSKVPQMCVWSSNLLSVSQGVSVHSSNLESRIISSARNGGGSSSVSNLGLSMDVKNGSDLGLEFDSNHWWSVSTVKEKENLLIKFRRNMARYCYYIETIFLCMSLSDIFCGCYYIETFRTYLTGYNFFDCLTFVEVQQFCFWYDLGLFS